MLIELAITGLLALALGVTAAAVYYRGRARRYQRALRKARRHRIRRIRHTLVQAEIQIGPCQVMTNMLVTTPLLESLANGLGKTLVSLPNTSVH